MLEEKVNGCGQKQIINSFDYIIKLGDKFLQVRLIRTKKWKKNEFTAPMPRARFINPQENFSYVIRKKDLIKLKKEKTKMNGEQNEKRF